MNFIFKFSTTQESGLRVILAQSPCRYEKSKIAPILRRYTSVVINGFVNLHCQESGRKEKNEGKGATAEKTLEERSRGCLEPENEGDSKTDKNAKGSEGQKFIHRRETVEGLVFFCKSVSFSYKAFELRNKSGMLEATCRVPTE